MSRNAPKYLTKAEKLLILEEIERRKSDSAEFTLTDIAEWAQRQMQLSFKPHASTISRIRKNESRIRMEGNRDRKKDRVVSCIALDAALAQWVCDMYSRKLNITGDMIKDKGVRLMQKTNEHLSEDEKLKLKFSNGWLQMFKKRHGFKAHKSHGESCDADLEAIFRDLPGIKNKLSNYALNDIFSADEFGHFYQIAPTQTIARAPLPGRKKQKARITYLACSNADGTENYPLMVIGNACRTRPLKGKYGHELGFDYHYNRKAWMTSELFFACIRRFDAYIGQTSGRKVALLIDNCTAPGTHDILPTLLHTDVIFLPPNTTITIQPMDSGVIAAVKVRYRRRQIPRALGFLDNSMYCGDSVYKVDILTAMRWMRDIWNELGEAIIINRWMHTTIIEHLLQQLEDSPMQHDAVLAERQELTQFVSEVVPSRVRVDVDKLVNPVEEDDCGRG